MITIIDISVPAETFPLGQILEEFPDIEIELERLVPLQEAIIPLFWVNGADADAIERTFAEDPLTESVRRLTEANGQYLYEIQWNSDMDGLVQTFIETGARILTAEGTADVWDFRLQFRSRDDLVAFREDCEERNIPLTLRRLYNPTVPEEDGRLTGGQYEALVAAYEHGYFEVPRATSMEDLAAEFGISDSALSQRIRRGTSALIAETLMADMESVDVGSRR